MDILRSLEDVNSCSNIFCFYGYCEDESKKQNYHEYNHVLRKWDDYYMLKVNVQKIKKFKHTGTLHVLLFSTIN